MLALTINWRSEQEQKTPNQQKTQEEVWLNEDAPPSLQQFISSSAPFKQFEKFKTFDFIIF